MTRLVVGTGLLSCSVFEGGSRLESEKGARAGGVGLQDGSTELSARDAEVLT